jgi:hypothetical protein
VEYDFENRFQLFDWAGTEERDPDAKWTLDDGLRLTGRRGLRWRAPFHKGIEVGGELSAEEKGLYTEFLRLETEEGEFVFRLGIEEKRILLRHREKGGDWITLGEKETPGVKVKAPVKVRVVAGAAGFVFHVDEGPALQVAKPLTGGGRLSLWGTPTSVAYWNLRIKCHLDPAWILGDNR